MKRQQKSVRNWHFVVENKVEMKIKNKIRKFDSSTHTQALGTRKINREFAKNIRCFGWIDFVYRKSNVIMVIFRFCVYFNDSPFRCKYLNTVHGLPRFHRSAIYVCNTSTLYTHMLNFSRQIIVWLFARFAILCQRAKDTQPPIHRLRLLLDLLRAFAILFYFIFFISIRWLSTILIHYIYVLHLNYLRQDCKKIYLHTIQFQLFCCCLPIE